MIVHPILPPFTHPSRHKNRHSSKKLGGWRSQFPFPSFSGLGRGPTLREDSVREGG